MAMRAALFKKRAAKSTTTDIGQGLLDGNSNKNGRPLAGVELQGGTRPGPNNHNNEADSPYHAMKDDDSLTSNPMISPRIANLPKNVQEKYRWDVCIVVPNPDHPENEKYFQNRKTQQETFESIMERLDLAGLQTTCFKSGDGDEIYIKVRASLERLQKHAEASGTQMLLSPIYLRDHIDRKNAKIKDDPDQSSLTPYQFIYAKYRRDRPDMFANAPRLDHPFSSIIRIRLILDIIFSHAEDCAALNLRALRSDGNDPGDPMSNSIIAYYPLHDEEARDELAAEWLNWRTKPWEQPLDDVKEYLGEKTALYFEFTAHYTTWLLPLAIAGVIVGIEMVVQSSSESLSHAIVASYLIPFYCIFVSFWSQLMIEYWKRHEARKAMEWGMSNFEEAETERPEFDGDYTISIINGDRIKFFDPKKKFWLMVYSYSLIGLMMLGVLGCVSLVFYLQYYFNNSNDEVEKNNGNTFVSILSAVQIIVLNYLYQDQAIGLTNMENHRTDTEYDDSLIGKLFAFSFVNSYASLFFIAFIKHNMGEACQGPCMVELAYQLTIIFASKLTIDKVSNYVSLWLEKRLKEREEENQREEARKHNREVRPPSKAELEKRLAEYDPSLGVLQDYSQIFVQFGFVTLFVAACPIAPLLTYFSNIIEMQSDGNKLLHMMRRAIPVGAQDIGTWLTILQMTAIISVVTNAGLLCYTMEIINFSGVGKVWLFIGFQYVIFIAMYIFAAVVDDVAPEVQIQIARQEYLASRAEMDDDELQSDDGYGHSKTVPRLTHFNIEDHKPKEEDDDP